MARKPNELSAAELSELGAAAAWEAVQRTYDLAAGEVVPGVTVKELGARQKKVKATGRPIADKVA